MVTCTVVDVLRTLLRKTLDNTICSLIRPGLWEFVRLLAWLSIKRRVVLTLGLPFIRKKLTRVGGHACVVIGRLACYCWLRIMREVLCRTLRACVRCLLILEIIRRRHTRIHWKRTRSMRRTYALGRITLLSLSPRRLVTI